MMHAWDFFSLRFFRIRSWSFVIVRLTGQLDRQNNRSVNGQPDLPRVESKISENFESMNKKFSRKNHRSSIINHSKTDEKFLLEIDVGSDLRENSIEYSLSIKTREEKRWDSSISSSFDEFTFEKIDANSYSPLTFYRFVHSRWTSSYRRFWS